jgi:hypothetical protein
MPRMVTVRTRARRRCVRPINQPAGERPEQVHHHRKETGSGTVVRNLPAERGEGKPGQFPELEAERDTDERQTKDESEQQVLQGDEQPPEEYPGDGGENSHRQTSSQLRASFRSSILAEPSTPGNCLFFSAMIACPARISV